MEFKEGDFIVYTGRLSTFDRLQLNDCLLFRIVTLREPGEHSTLDVPGPQGGPEIRLHDVNGEVNPNIRMATEEEVVKWDLYALNNQVL